MRRLSSCVCARAGSAACKHMQATQAMTAVLDCERDMNFDCVIAPQPGTTAPHNLRPKANLGVSKSWGYGWRRLAVPLLFSCANWRSNCVTCPLLQQAGDTEAGN